MAVGRNDPIRAFKSLLNALCSQVCGCARSHGLSKGWLGLIDHGQCLATETQSFKRQSEIERSQAGHSGIWAEQLEGVGSALGQTLERIGASATFEQRNSAERLRKRHF